ncbi:MAG: hypothetical protein ACI9MR_004160 [Myxococcota bacterium]|jgi:hypothetical protein
MCNSTSLPAAVSVPGMWLLSSQTWLRRAVTTNGSTFGDQANCAVPLYGFATQLTSARWLQHRVEVQSSVDIVNQDRALSASTARSLASPLASKSTPITSLP